MMTTYHEQLTDLERLAVERALDTLGEELGRKLANDDRAARAAEALAVYLLESRLPCGHSACRQNFIDTGESACVKEGDLTT